MGLAIGVGAAIALTCPPSRAVKRTTGFSPNELAPRFAEDESFRLYRPWTGLNATGEHSHDCVA